ncbi:exonuclease domain-containing protein [Mesorhizobium sp. WSM3876]|uniref:exonuclease domain-containing protein n=1 Tax=Mesorhizobium sp. WSM3876 TaxID=422277 RepID=UPI000BAFA1D1|nr:exonuclease domain-containing protein [Mesorhizobium sp. WSM3876]PBB84538.1 exodeoxyribonuclease I [Mesorhizobium sp. WSM3876]
MAGFVFYDTETTGLKFGWDQIVHFAAIRTDENLNEVSRFEARCRLQPHTIPHPAALLTNRLPISRLTDHDLPTHYGMICAIREQLLAWSPAIILGYNSMRFDEEMLRHALFQSLFPAYLTSNHGNSRTDVLNLALAAAALPPHCLNVPLNESGRPTFRLERLAAANGLNAREAHDAMSDAETALTLARIVRDRSVDVWQRFVRFSKKATLADFVVAEDAFVLTEFFGNDAYHRAVTCIGSIPDNVNGRFCLDLSDDPDGWAVMNDDTLRLAIARKGSPVRRIAVNAAPAVAALWEAPEAMLGGLEIDLLEARGRRIRDDVELSARIVQAYTAGWQPRTPSLHPEDQLYFGGFPLPPDESRMQEFHAASWAGRARIAEEFDDARLVAFGRRLVHVEHRSALDEAARLHSDLALADRLLNDAGGGLTLGLALAAVDEMCTTGTPDPQGLLLSYRDWLIQRTERVEEFLQRRRQGGVA